VPAVFWPRFLLALLVFALLGAIFAGAQENSCLHRTLPLGIQVSSETLLGPIRLEDFQARLGGQPVRILSIVPDDRPHRIVMLLDASGSMKDKWESALWLASALADSPPPNTPLALIIFGEGIKEKTEFSKGQEAVSERLHQLRSDLRASKQLVRGSTAIYDSLITAIDLFGTPTSADSLYLISDGGDNISRANLGAAVQRLTSSGVRLFVSVIESVASGRATIEEVNGPQDMKEAAKRTGGAVIFLDQATFSRKPWDQERLSEAVRPLYHKMIHEYRMKVELSQRLKKQHTWELELVGKSKEQWKGVRLTYPTELAACNP